MRIATPISVDVYEAAVAYFRRMPGDHLGCARVLGIDRRTARRIWQGPPYRRVPFVRVVRDVLADEDAAKQARARVANESVAAALKSEAAEAARLADEARAIETSILRVARNDVLGGLATLARLNAGMQKLAQRLNDQLERGTHANGKPLVIDVPEALLIIQRYSASVGRLADACQTIVATERIKSTLPVAAVGLDLATVSVEDAEQELALAREILDRAKALGDAARSGGEPH